MTVTFYTSENYTSYRVEGEHEVVARKIIDSKLSFRPNGYFFSPKFKQGVWDGYIRLDSHEGFPTGLLPSITRELEAEGIEYQLEDSIIPVGLPELPDKIQLYHEKLPNNELYLRDYQYDAVVKTLEKRRGIVHAATNAGKCLTKDTNILTTNGYKTIEQIFSENGTPVENKEDVVEAKDVMLVNRYGEAERATHLTFNGIRKVTEVVTANGKRLRATSNHPLLVYTKNSKGDAETAWKTVENLEIGDTLVTRTEKGNQGSELVVELNYAGKEETFDVHLPETHSFIANGIVNHNTEIACGIMKYVEPTLISDMDENIIFFTHSIEIATQSKKRIEERLQRKVGFVGKGEWDVQEITVVMIPTISRHLKPPSKSKITYTKEMKSIKTVVDLASGAILKRDDSNLKTMQTISEVLNSVDSEANFDAKAVEIATQIATESQTSLEVYERVKELKEALKEYERAKLGKSLEKHEAVMSLLENCRCFIADEAHHSSSTTWYDTFMLMENAEFRIGLTGTVDEKDDPVNLAKLRGATGETIIEISNDFLIRKGYSAKPTIYLETIDKPENMVAHNYQDAYAIGIVDNEYRNEVIARRVKDRVRSEKACLVIVNQTKHGEYLEKRLKELDVDCEFIHGSRSNEDRQSALDNLADGTLSVLIATTILDEGVDVSGINCVWMAGGGKSYKKVLQRVGRGLRKKEDGSGLEVYDFLDYTNNYLTRHTLDRYDYYRDEKFEIVKTDRIM